MGIFRRPDSPFWWCWFETAPKGQQRLKTTFLINGDTRETRAKNREAAEAFYHTHMLRLGQVRHGLREDRPAITVREFLAWYRSNVVAHHRGKDREIEILQHIEAAFGARQLAALTRADVLEWRSQRAAATTASTSNRELDVLKGVLAAAVPKYLEASPLLKLKRLRGPKRETRVLTPAEERRLLKVLAPADRALLICALDTLMRLSDVVNLRRDQDRGRYLLVEDPKVTPYKVPVSTRLRQALDAIPGKAPYYFPHRRLAKNARDYRSSVRSMLRRACARAKPKVPYGRKQGGITFHALRHTGTTRLVESNVSLRVVQEIGGWSSMRQLERYAHPTERAKVEAVEMIGKQKRARSA